MKTDLLDAFLCRELDPETAAKVDSALRSDKALREVYFQQQKMDAVLRIIFNGDTDVSSPEFRNGIMARLESQAAGSARSFSKSVLTEILEEKEKIVPLRWPDFVKAAAVAAAAVIALMFFLREVYVGENTADSAVSSAIGGSAEASPFKARIQSARDAVWTGESDFSENGWIGDGPLQLQSGIVELAFNSGARAFVEGPALLSVESENRTFLQSGKLTAEVSPQASGFTVNTPRMNIMDIGTRFGVSVDPKTGETEVHVMEGLVEASRSNGNTVSQLIEEGSAMRADSRSLSALESIGYAGDAFSLTAGPSSLPAPVIEYLFDENGGSEIFDTGNRRKGGPYDLSLLQGSQFDDAPRRSPGVRGGGIVFQSGQVLSSPLSRDFQLSDPFTICFWLKIPPRVGRETDDFILAWGRENRGWAAGCRDASGGGTLIVKNGENASLGGTTDLADGKWHHVAIRFIGGESARIGSHLHLYVDGALEPVRMLRDDSIAAGAAEEFRIGDLQKTGFAGWIDQATVFDHAISTNAIQQMVTN